MIVTVLIIITVLLILGIIYTIFSIRFAEVDENHIEEPFDENAYSKPGGWKVGKMPLELQNSKYLEKKEIIQSREVDSFEEDIFSSLLLENTSGMKKENLL